jgi:hypothetical protein
VSLDIGAVSNQVNVTEKTAALQTNRADVRGEVIASQLQDLPMPHSRNYEQLLSTIPGVEPNRIQGSSNSPSNLRFLRSTARAGYSHAASAWLGLQ